MLPPSDLAIRFTKLPAEDTAPVRILLACLTRAPLLPTVPESAMKISRCAVSDPLLPTVPESALVRCLSRVALGVSDPLTILVVARNSEPLAPTVPVRTLYTNFCAARAPLLLTVPARILSACLTRAPVGVMAPASVLARRLVTAPVGVMLPAGFLVVDLSSAADGVNDPLTFWL